MFDCTGNQKRQMRWVGHVARSGEEDMYIQDFDGKA